MKHQQVLAHMRRCAVCRAAYHASLRRGRRGRTLSPAQARAMVARRERNKSEQKKVLIAVS